MNADPGESDDAYIEPFRKSEAAKASAHLQTPRKFARSTAGLSDSAFSSRATLGGGSGATTNGGGQACKSQSYCAADGGQCPAPLVETGKHSMQ